MHLEVAQGREQEDLAQHCQHTDTTKAKPKNVQDQHEVKRHSHEEPTKALKQNERETALERHPQRVPARLGGPYPWVLVVLVVLVDGDGDEVCGGAHAVRPH